MRAVRTGYALCDFDPADLPAIEAVFDLRSVSRDRVYAAFVTMYGPYIVSLVSRFNRVSRNTRDLIQDVYLHLTQADIIRKFFIQAQESIPENLTGAQSAQLLGMSWKLFALAQERLRMTNFPKPVHGSGQDPTALYRTTEVLDYSTDRRQHFREECLKLIDVSVLLVVPTRKHFLKYLSQAVHHHFANFCRGEFRHNRERVPDTFPEFRPTVDNPSPWESRLASPTACTQEKFAEISLLFEKLRRTPVEPHFEEVFNSLTDGYDIEQAIDQLEITADAKRMSKRMIKDYIPQERRRPAQRKPTEVSAH